MKFLAYIFYLAVVTGSVLLREYQLIVGAGGSIISYNMLVAAGCVLGAVVLLMLACLFLSRVKASDGKSAAPGVLVMLCAAALLAYGGYSTYQAYTMGAVVISLVATVSNILLAVGLFGAGLYMKKRGQKPAGFLLMFTMLWPVAWLLHFVAGNLVFIHKIDDLIHFAFLVSGCAFYLQLCTEWCVPESSGRNRRTLFMGLFHAGLFAMANLPSCVYRFVHDSWNIDLYISTAFFAVYLICVFIICVYLRGAKSAAAAVKSKKRPQPETDTRKADKDEIAAFFSKTEEALAQPKTEPAPVKADSRPTEEELFAPKQTQEAAEKEQKQPVLEKEEFAPVQKEEKPAPAPEPVIAQPEPEPEVIPLPAELDKLLQPKQDDDPIADILNEVRQKKEARAKNGEEPFVYRGKTDSKRPGRFK